MMQALKNIVLNGAITLALMFGLTLAATAATDFEKIRFLAENGSALSQAKLGMHYKQGIEVRQDDDKAFEWFEKSAEQGNDYGQALLGLSYLEGLGVRQDYIKAREWFEKSAEQNNTSAQVFIGTIYELGEGVRQNKTTAKEWYGRACDNGGQNGCQAYKRLNEEGY